MPSPPPRSTRSTVSPPPRNERTNCGDPLEGAPIGVELDELRADMHGEPDGRDPGERRGETVGRRRLVEFDAEFVFFFAGGDLGVGQRVDIGVDPERDRRRAAELGRDGAQQRAAPGPTRH